MSRARAERLARNESSFRALNDALGAKVFARRAEPHADLAGFVCECGNAECAEVLRVDLERYEEVRQDACLFLVCPGHEITDVEDVVQREDAFLVVRKHDDVSDIVHETNPRA
jgi:hypothetical protein